MKTFYTSTGRSFATTFFLVFALMTMIQTPAISGCPFAKVRNFFMSFSNDWGCKIYENQNYSGQEHIFKKGEYRPGRECHSDTPISYKINRGYQLFFYDKYGKLLKKAHRSSAHYPGRYDKVVVKYVGYHGYGHPTSKKYDQKWYDDYKVAIYDAPYYKGEYQCFRKAGWYYSGKHCQFYKTCSFKIAKGYEVWFYDKYKRCIKKATHDEDHWSGGFYKFEVKHVGYGGHAGGGYGHDDHYDHKYYDDWKCILYYDPYYKGEYQCFRKTGQYYGGKHCPSSYGSGYSFKVREGYQMWFYDRYGRCIYKADHNEDHYSKPFYKFEVRRVGGSHAGGHHGGGYGHKDHYDHKYYDDWKCILYYDPYYKGDYQCFRKSGEYYSGKHCPSSYGSGYSFKVRKGYAIWFYDKYGRCIYKADHHDDHYSKPFYKFEVKKVGYAGGRPGYGEKPGYGERPGYGEKPGYGEEKPGYDPDWKCLIYNDSYYKGSHRCFTKSGEYYGGKHCPNYYRKGISIKVRKGYEIYLYDKYNRVIQKSDRDIKYYNKGFHRFEVKRVGYGGR